MAAGVMRFIHTGVSKEPNYLDESTPDLTDGYLPLLPEDMILPQAVAAPWFDGHEDPYAYPAGMPFLESPEPQYVDQSAGASMPPGAYDGTYYTHGPVSYGLGGMDESGGLGGDQALGRRMKFDPYIPERYDANGITMPSYADELAAAIAANGQGQVTDAEMTTSLLLGI